MEDLESRIAALAPNIEELNALLATILQQDLTPPYICASAGR